MEIKPAEAPKKPAFNMVCHEMYKRFGAAYSNLVVLAKSDAERELLVAQLHELRDWVRDAFDQIKEAE